MPSSRPFFRVLVLFAAMAAASCVPPEAIEDVPRFNERTLMGQIQARGELIVGYDPGFIPFAFESLPDGEPAGFAIELSQIVADGLGVGLEFVAMETAELMTALEAERPDPETGERAGALDLGFPIVPLTEENVRGFGFGNPYFIAHQRLLVEQGSPIQEVDDLSGEKVCAILDPITGVDLTQLDPSIEMINGIKRTCFKALAKGEVAAVTAHDALLLEELFRVGETDVDLVGEDLSTVGYGAAGPPASATFMSFVSSQLGLAKDDGRYMAIYDEWIRPLLGEAADDEPPGLGVTEAAALYPTEIG